MEKLVDYLKQLDLSDVEAKLYLTLLQTGPASVRDLAQTIDIKRTTAYFYIDQLVDKGLIMKLVKGSKKLVAANEPENLKHLVEKKRTQAISVKENFPNIINMLTNINPVQSNINNADIRFYKGTTNARKIYEEAFKANEVRTYARVDKKEPLWPDNTAVFRDAFKKNKNLKMWEIIYGASSTAVSEDVNDNTDRYFYKFLPNHLKLSSEDILIYENKVAVINFRGGGSSIVLQSADFYNNFKELFDFMWNLIPDPEKAQNRK